jgi:hypothetical protein
MGLKNTLPLSGVVKRKKIIEQGGICVEGINEQKSQLVFSTQSHQGIMHTSSLIDHVKPFAQKEVIPYPKASTVIFSACREC